MIKINGKEVLFERFPNGETLFKHSFEETEHITVDFKYEDDSDLIKLLLVKKELDSVITGLIGLNITYYPYSRMDRGGDGIVFTLKHIATFINSLKFDGVIINEPHSDKCVELTHGSGVRWLTTELFEDYKKEEGFSYDNDYLVFPDKGAYDRYIPLFPNAKILYGEKVRNFKTGVIESLKIIGEYDGKGKAIIIDDLCCGGYTFKLTARELKRVGVGEISLILGHCEDTIYKRGLLEDTNITKVYTTNSILNLPSKSEKLIIKEMV